MPLPPGRFGGWVGDSSLQGDIWGGRAAGTAPLSLWVSLPASPRAPTRNPLQPPGVPSFPWFVGSSLWDFLLHQYWLE